MASIKLDKNVIVSFRFTVADESRLPVVLQFSFFFFAASFSCEKRTLLLMLNFLAVDRQKDDLLAFSQFEFCGSGSAKKNIKKGPFPW